MSGTSRHNNTIKKQNIYTLLFIPRKREAAYEYKKTDRSTSNYINDRLYCYWNFIYIQCSSDEIGVLRSYSIMQNVSTIFICGKKS